MGTSFFRGRLTFVCLTLIQSAAHAVSEADLAQTVRDDASVDENRLHKQNTEHDQTHDAEQVLVSSEQHTQDDEESGHNEHEDPDQPDAAHEDEVPEEADDPDLLSQTYDFHDYRNDAESFLNLHSAASLSQLDSHGGLATASVEEVNKFWAGLFEHISSGEGPGTGSYHPWIYGEPVNDSPSALEMTRSEFPERMFHGSPGMIRGVEENWTAPRTWGFLDMQKRLRDVDFTLNGFSYPSWIYPVAHGPADTIHSDTIQSVHQSLSEYLAKGEGKLGYTLFVNEPQVDTIQNPGVRALEILRKDFTPHPIFAATPEEKHAVLALDAAGGSHGFHQHAAVWQTQVKGHKAWWLLPPSVPPDRGHVENVEFGAAPVVNGTVYKAPNACVMLRARTPPQGARFVIATPGDTIVVPEDWWHATCALDAYTAAIGGWLADQRMSEYLHPRPTGPSSPLQQVGGVQRKKQHVSKRLHSRKQSWSIHTTGKTSLRREHS